MHTEVFTGEITCVKVALKYRGQRGEKWGSCIKHAGRMLTIVEILKTKYLCKSGFLNYTDGTD